MNDDRVGEQSRVREEDAALSSLQARVPQIDLLYDTLEATDGDMAPLPNGR